jgi:DNA-directed RNA polymerase subunit RPC12/RpoP
MSYSATKISCKDCLAKFYGYLDGLFDISATYAATCPKCEGQTFFNSRTKFMCFNLPEVSEIPEGYVEIMYLKPYHRIT